MRTLAALLEAPPERCALMALDHVTTPANVGMILRACTVLGLDGEAQLLAGPPSRCHSPPIGLPM